MILIDLVLKNVKTQLKNYLMYFISMTFSVMVYYSFTSMSYDRHLIERASQSQNIGSSLQAASVLILLFILVFMYTANSFFLKKRRKEIGIYNLLGMRKIQIGLMFFLENILIGLGALVTGVFLGIVFSRLFAMLLIKALYLEIDLTFVFSLKAVGQTCLLFLVILGIVSFRSGRIVYRYKLVDLFKANQKGDRYKKNTIWTYAFGLLGMGLISYGYYQASHLVSYALKWDGITTSNLGVIYSVLLILFYCVLGTYLFFHSFLQLVLSLITKCKNYYYRDLHLVTIGTLRYQLKRNGTTLATIAVLLGTTIAAIGGATDVYSFGLSTVDDTYPFDILVDNRQSDQLDFVLEKYQEHSITQDVILEIKQVGSHFQEQSKPAIWTDHTDTIGAVSLSNYLKIQKDNPRIGEISLTNEEDIVLLDQILNNYSNSIDLKFSQLKLEGQEKPLRIKAVMSDKLGGLRSIRYNQSVIVVSDALYQRLSQKGQYQIRMVSVANSEESERLVTDVEENFPKRFYQQVTQVTYSEGQVTTVMAEEQQLTKELVEENRFRSDVRSSLSLRYPVLRAERVTFGLLVYNALFLGMVFLMATGSIIMLKQLSEAEDEKSRYQMLRKLGVSQKSLRASVYKNNLVVFLLPLVIGYLHSYFALRALHFLIDYQTAILTWASRGFLLVIYGIFYLCTTKAYNRIVNA